MAGTSDLDRQIEQLRRCEYIKEVTTPQIRAVCRFLECLGCLTRCDTELQAEVKALCNKACEILLEESNVQRVHAPVTVRPSLRKTDNLFVGPRCRNSRPSLDGATDNSC